MEKKIKFAPDFYWGAATSGPQSEGSFGKEHENVMDYWFRTKPEDFFDGVGPNVTSDFYHRYAEDFKLMRECGFNSFRTSIQWTRLIKDFETGEPDMDGVAFYQKVIASAKENNIELFMNLHHFDMPIELFEKYGGWESKHVVDLFVKFAQTAFQYFGKDIKHWTTFNEPMVIPEAGYLYGFHFPKYKGKGKEAVQVIYNLNLASAKVINLYHEMNLGGEIGVILNLTPALPRSESEEDLAASQFTDDFFNRSFLNPAVNGVFPQTLIDVLERDGVLWQSTDEELQEIAKGKVDFLGVNYYHPKRVKAQENPENYENPWTPDKYFAEYDKPGVRMNPYRGWEIFPKSIYDIAMNIKENYGNVRWFISENGMGVEGEAKYINENGIIEDDYRIDFYKEHLAWLAKAIEEGCNCVGYHTWTAVDCWSWNNAYKNRYGFIALDLDTQKRTIKKSGRWYAELSKNHSYIYDLDEEIK